MKFFRPPPVKGVSSGSAQLNEPVKFPFVIGDVLANGREPHSTRLEASRPHEEAALSFVRRVGNLARAKDGYLNGKRGRALRDIRPSGATSPFHPPMAGAYPTGAGLGALAWQIGEGR